MRKADKGQVKAKKVKPLLIVITVIMCLAFGFSLFWYIRSLLPVKRMAVSGSIWYADSEIINASDVKKGDRLYKINDKEVEARLLEACPYLESVKVEKRFPNTVIFVIEEKMPSWYVEVSGDYYVLDKNMIVLEEQSTDKMLISNGVPSLKLPNVKDLRVGQLAEFGDDENETKRVMDTLKEIQASPLRHRITHIDMEHRFAISVVVDGKHEVYLGKPKNIKDKLIEVRSILETPENKEKYKNGSVISAENIGEISIAPKQ